MRFYAYLLYVSEQMMMMMMMMMMNVYVWHLRQFINLYNIRKLVETKDCYSIS